MFREGNIFSPLGGPIQVMCAYPLSPVLCHETSRVSDFKSANLVRDPYASIDFKDHEKK